MSDKLLQLQTQLNITFEEHDYKKKQGNVYEANWKKDQIRSLTLVDVAIEDLGILRPFANELGKLTLVNCTVGNFSALIHLEWLFELNLDNVIIQDIDELSPPFNNEVNYRGNLGHVYLRNMTIPHLGVLAPMGKRIDHLFITNCTLHNLFEVNLFPRLYDMRLTGVIIEQTDNDVIYPPIEDSIFIRLLLEDMTIEDIGIFSPIGQNFTEIGLDDCRVGSIRNLKMYPRLGELRIGYATTIRDQALPEENSGGFILAKVVIGDRWDEQREKFDFKNLGAIAPYLKELQLKSYESQPEPYLAQFTQLESLILDDSDIDLTHFLPIAHQIKSISFNGSDLTNSQAFSHFSQLSIILIAKNWDENGAIKDFRKLLPLKHQLKKLDIDEEGITHLEVIKDFTALESLSIWPVSYEVVVAVLSLSSLKRLQIFAFMDEDQPNTPPLDLKALKNITHLSFSASDELSCEGIEFLTQLERLDLGIKCSYDKLHHLTKLRYLVIDDEVDINQVQSIPTLEVLELEVSGDYQIHSLAQFPNLERLQIEGSKKINLGKLEKLRVFVAQWMDLETTECFNQVPNLEKLDLSYCEIKSIKNLDKLTNLKMLDLQENNDLESIEGLANLKKLEFLNLYETKVSDITVLNTLPNLEMVNLGQTQVDKDSAEQQLNDPEVAIFMYRPRIPFSIWERDYFEL